MTKNFTIRRLELYAPLSPRYVYNIQPAIKRYFQDLLYKYSASFQGIPIAYNIIGVSRQAPIFSDCEDIYLDCLVEFLYFNVKEGDFVKVNDGMVMDTFLVEGEKVDGKIMVTDILRPGHNCAQFATLAVCPFKKDKKEE